MTHLISQPRMLSEHSMPAPKRPIGPDDLQDLWETCNAVGGSYARNDFELGIIFAVAKMTAAIEAKQAEVQ